MPGPVRLMREIRFSIDRDWVRGAHGAEGFEGALPVSNSWGGWPSAVLITMGCGEACPVVPGLRRDDWPLQDPKGQSMDHVRRIRDDVRRRVVELIDRLGVAVDA